MDVVLKPVLDERITTSIAQPPGELNLLTASAYSNGTWRSLVVILVKKRSLFLWFLLCVPIILSACSAAALPVAPTAPPLPLTFHYADPLGWFETQLPASWDVKAFDVMQGKGVPPLLIARAGVTDALHWPAFTLTSLLLPNGKDVSFLRQHWTWEKMGGQAKLAAPLLRQEKTFVRDGRKCYRAELYLAGKAPQRWQVYMTTAGSRAYVLLFMDRDKDFSGDAALFDAMWNAFRPLPAAQSDTGLTGIVGQWMRKDGGTYRFGLDGRYQSKLPGEKTSAGFFVRYQNAIFFYPDGGGWDMEVLRMNGSDSFILGDTLFARMQP